MIAPFVGGFYEDSAGGFDNQRCINWYPVPGDAMSKTPDQLYPTSGLRGFATNLTTTQGCRGVYEASNGRLFGVWGANLIELNVNGNATDYTTSSGISIAENGNVSMSDNGTQLIVLTGGSGFIFTFSSSTLVEISDADFPDNANQVEFLDGYFVISVTGTQRFYISAINDGTSWDALDFASIVSTPDEITGLKKVNTDLWLFGKKSAEVWQNTGASTFPFERLSGASQNIGTENPWTIKELKGQVYFYGSNKNGFGCVFRTNGYEFEMISTDVINTKLKDLGNRVDIRAIAFQERGHYFYQLNLPSLNTSFVFDATTGKWHERAFWDKDTARWKSDLADFHASAFNQNFGTSSATPLIYTMDQDYYFHQVNLIRRLRRSPHLPSENKRLRYNKVEFEFERGQGQTTGLGVDPKMSYRFSNNGGKNYSTTTVLDMGKQGEYDTRMRLTAQGIGRNRIHELECSVDAKAHVMGMYLDVENLGS